MIHSPLLMSSWSIENILNFFFGILSQSTTDIQIYNTIIINNKRKKWHHYLYGKPITYTNIKIKIHIDNIQMITIKRFISFHFLSLYYIHIISALILMCPKKNTSPSNYDDDDDDHHNQIPKMIMFIIIAFFVIVVYVCVWGLYKKNGRRTANWIYFN